MNKMRGIERGKKRGLTLIEMTLVMAILVTLAGISLLVTGGMDRWTKGKAAAEQLRIIYVAQKTYMADHPTANVATLTPALLIPYLPNGAVAIPVVLDIDDAPMAVSVDVMPPTVADDTSGATDDGLWDVGKP